MISKLHGAFCGPTDDSILTAKVVNLQKANQPQPVVTVTPKPKGNSYNPQKKMGLEDDPMKYDEIKVCCRSPFLPPLTFTTDPDSLEETD